MLCQNCNKRNATVQFTKVVNNKKIELYLCEQCANEKGQINFNAPFSLGDFFSGFTGYGIKNAYVTGYHQAKKCSRCGMSYTDFQKTGKLGCSECYSVFRDEITHLVKRIHGVVEHQGKVPSGISAKFKIKHEIQSLKEQLGKAIQSEEYEKAAKLRDKIRQLENLEEGDDV